MSVELVFGGAKRARQPNAEEIRTFQDVFNSLPSLDTSRSGEWEIIAAEAVRACVAAWEKRAGTEDENDLGQLENKFKGYAGVVSDEYIETGKENERGAISLKDMPWVARVHALLAGRIRFRSNADVRAKLDAMAAFLDGSLGGQQYDIVGANLNVLGHHDFDMQLARTSGNKSGDWFAALLYDRMPAKPKCISRIGFEKNIVVVDDCSYSGNQLAALLERITDEDGFTLYVLVPYMTRGAWTKVCATKDRRGYTRQRTDSDAAVTVHGVRGRRTVFWKPEFIPDTLEELESVLDQFPGVSKARKDAVRSMRRIHQREVNGAGLFFFEHKFPDHVSFPVDFHEVKDYLETHGVTTDRQEAYKTQLAEGGLRPVECFEMRRDDLAAGWDGELLGY